MKTQGFGLLALVAGTAAIAAPHTPLPDVSPINPGQHVVINIPQQRLFLYVDGKLSKIYPVAVGKAATQTDLGRHIIGAKTYNPTWHIPKSIQKELKNGKTTVPPGPNNPLGPVFVRMGDPKLGLGIHGTNAPSSVPGVRSHGCVRMKSPDALEFAKTITSGSPVDVTYQMAAVNVDADNNVWLAAFRDPYNRKDLDTAALRKSIEAWAKAHGKTVHTKRLDIVLKGRSGALNCITCGSAAGKINGSLQSLAWTSGSGELAKPVTAPPAPEPADQVLPEGSEIEVEEDAGAAAAATATPVSKPEVSPQPASQPEEPTQPATTSAPETIPARPTPTPKNVPASYEYHEQTDSLF